MNEDLAEQVRRLRTQVMALTAAVVLLAAGVLALWNQHRLDQARECGRAVAYTEPC